jgi:2',3'-cyclic-nucleotide 2'-phosphodiesterase (5'-nucleotidase family)
MKKQFLLLTSILLSLWLTGCELKEQTTGSNPTTSHVDLETLPLTILTVNDLHGHIEQESDGTNGLSNMAYLINEIRDENPLHDVILIANGDMLQGTSISNMTKGLAVLESMNAMGFDAMGIGNHEFDWEIATILDYFDNDDSNGEAHFPLLNANIHWQSDDSLLTVDNGKVFESIVVEREGVDVGIISYVGDVYSSIAYDKVDEFYFNLAIKDSVEEIAKELKNDGVEMIVVNIHGGNFDIENYEYNRELALLKDQNGDYLVDLVINGHTHSYQKGMISRPNGVDMPVVQAGGNGNYFGAITLMIDMDSFEVTETALEIYDVRNAGKKYDATVETIIDRFADELGDEELAMAGETINQTSQLFDWTGNVMLAATGADIAISNKGGVRSTGGIAKNQAITMSQLYEVSPFDNTVWLFEASYQEIRYFLNNSSIFYTLANGIELKDGETYTIAIISYVYTNYDQMDYLRSNQDIDTNLFIRDLLVEDLRLRGAANVPFTPSKNSEASIGLRYQESFVD